MCRRSATSSRWPCGQKKKPRTHPRLDKAGNTAYNLLAEIGEHTAAMEKAEGAEGSFKKWPTIKKMAWISSEAFCMGFMNASRIVYEALIMTLQEQAAEQAKQGGNN